MQRREPKAGEPYVETREIDRWRPIYYAAASGDFNPIHIDDEMGQLAGQPGKFLQGLCTMAMACEAAINAAGGDPGALKKVRVRFSRPVLPGDTLTFTVTPSVVEGGRVAGEITAKNQAGDDVLKNASFELRRDGEGR